MALPDGTVHGQALDTQQITDGYNVNLNVDYALTVDQTLRIGAQRIGRIG